MEKNGYVYIMTDRCYGTLYIGVTSDLLARVWQHREGFVDGFTKKHGLNILVWYQNCGGIYEAITREKQLKKWNRAWKVALIQKENPTWRDLYLDFTA